MAEGLLTMFGKAYDTVGSADKNLILLTRGDLKVRWGNKYIDLIKNGKINVDVDLIKRVKDKEEIFKDGIYVIEKDDNLEVWLYSDGTLINLVGEIGTTYVSFIGTQEVDAEKRFQALINAGFYYKTYADAEKANIQSGLIYIDDQRQLYYAKGGKLYKYEQTLIVPDPLIVGNITIDGKSSRISGAEVLSFGTGKNDYISLTDKGVEMLLTVITSDIVQSDTFEHNKAGYSIYYDPVKNWHCMELDYLLVRNYIDYGGIEDILYDDLVEKVEKHLLVKGKKYRIIDFQNEWEIEDDYVDPNDVHYQYFWPIILTAKDESEFETLGYFCDNKKWIIEYDINYHYYVNSGVDDNGNYWIKYTKGRITKLTDEYNNTCNYDFKHRKFKLNGSEELTSQLFTFNVVNADKGTDERYPLSFKNVHDNWDATLLEDVKVRNNTFYIKEPSYESVTITNKDGENETVDAAVIYDECFLFPNCSTIYPYDNEILESQGKYVITSEFHGNKAKGFLLDNPEKVEFKCNFYDNTFGKVYMKSSKGPTVFTNNKKFYNNVAKDVTAATFLLDCHDNVFLNITSCKFDANMENNVFDEDLNNVNFKCTEMKNNHITGVINTGNSATTYPIEAKKFNNNIINNITKSAITCSGKNITDNSIHDIIQYGINNSTIKNVIALDLSGLDGKTDPNEEEEEMTVTYGWYKDNYLVDAAVDDYVVHNWNFGYETRSQ